MSHDNKCYDKYWMNPDDDKCYDKYWKNPDDDKCYDKYWKNPDDESDWDTGIFGMQTQIIMDEDSLSPRQLDQMKEVLRMCMDWKTFGKIMSEDMPGAAGIIARGLRKAFYERSVQDKLNEFFQLLAATADRRALTNPREGSLDVRDPLAVSHWVSASKKLKKRRKNPAKPKKRNKRKTTKCKSCKKNIKQSGRGRPKLYHSRCKKKRK